MKYILALVLVFPSISFACSCLHQPLSKHVKDAKKIYVGVLTSSRIVETEKENEWPYVEGTLSVETVIKGEAKETEIIRTGFGGGDCGIPMTIGRAYVIFYEREGYHIGSCGASGELLRYEEKEYVEKLRSLVSKP